MDGVKLYKNIGAPILRKEGKIERGAVFEPTERELVMFAYKLRPYEEEPATPPAAAIVRKPATPPSEWPGWPLRMPPELYLRLHPYGQYADLAKSFSSADVEVDVPEDRE